MNKKYRRGEDIGQACTVGLEGVVTKSFENNQILAGNPADPIDRLKNIRNAQKINL
ncbi:hypothetical protein [Anaerophilus nitritogenes]|uniref:hypothetical protein n=1 Tax=Anaerophilus nitritogenes TaxID=2498136 RepID=UPI0013EAEDFB|nr:hypothetical protein [Anaerophilus nitritogenes]